jgi:hypothetical protein
MLYSIAVQSIFIGFIFFFAYFQSTAVMAMREYVPINNPFKGKYHFRGNMLAIFIGIVLSAYFFTVSERKIDALFMPLILTGWYGLLFDQWLNKFSGYKKYYLGITAKFDVWMSKHFPHGDGAEVVDCICIFFIASLNILIHYV